LNWNFVTMEVHGGPDSDTRGWTDLFKGKPAAPNGISWRVNKSLALGMVKPEFAAQSSERKSKSSIKSS
jgi:dimethylglycine dehydrogenase